MRFSATTAGTKRYRERFSGKLPADHFKQTLGLLLSSIGLGSYLGYPDSATDHMYEEAVKTALELGCNVIDTAINYRFQRSERCIGRALRELIESSRFSRDEIFISSKAGFIPYEDAPPSEPNEYIRNTFLDSGIIQPGEIVAGSHCIAPRYLEHQLEQSLSNLQLACIDLYFVHNPETQFQEVVRDEFNHRMRDAFTALERAVQAGKIQYYGTATWNGYRAAPSSRDYLSLSQLIGLAEEAAGKEHHFRAIQLPLSLATPEAFARQNQEWDGRWSSVLDLAAANGMLVMASASIYQGNLAHGLPAELRNILGQRTDAQNAIQFVRSTPGVTSALVGMKHINHVLENMETALSPPLVDERYMKLFKSA